MKKQSNYTIENKGEISVVVSLNKGNAHYYPYKPIFELMEINCEIDHEKLILKKSNGEFDFSYRLMSSMTDNLARWQSRKDAIGYIGEKLIIEAEKAIKKNARELFNTVKEGRTNPIWLSLKPIADSSITHFKTDFYYQDSLLIQKIKPAKFIWLVRNTGTWLIYHKNEFHDAVLEQERKEKRNKIFFWNGVKLTEIDIDKAFQLYKTLE